MATGHRTISSKAETRSLVVILGLFTILATLYSIYVPIFEASDEVWHFPMVEIIARTGTLPIQPLTPGQSSGPWRQEGSQPPLYYAVAAGLTFWIDTGDMEEVRQLNPHVAAGENRPDQSNLNLVVHNPDNEKFPWKGTALAVHVVRFFSVMLGIWSVYLTWALVKELYPQKWLLAVITAGIHAFTPMFLFISSSVNNDNLIVPLSTLALLLMVRHIKYQNPLENKSSYKRYLFTSSIIALAMLTKASGIGLIPLLLATLAWQWWQRVKMLNAEPKLVRWLTEFPFVLRAMMTICVPILALSGWWFYRNHRLYGDFLGLNAFYAVLGMRDVSANLKQLWAERYAFMAGYWGNFGGLTIPMPHWILVTLNAIAVIACIGSLFAFIKWTLKPQPNSLPSTNTILDTFLSNMWPFNWTPLTAARALSWAWPAAVFISWIRWATMTWSSQGRLIFSAIPMWSLILTIGLRAINPIRNRTCQTPFTNNLAPGLLTAFFLVLCSVALPLWIMPAYKPPVSDQRHPPTSYVRIFDDIIALRGYHLHNNTVQPGQTVNITLYWQAIQPTQQNASIFIHVLGHNERIVAQRDTFPARGLVPTTRLTPGMMWYEHYQIKIPELALTPDQFSIALGVYDSQSGQRVPVYDSEETYQGEMVIFASGRIIRHDTDIPNKIHVQFGDSILLEGYHVNDTMVQRGDKLHIMMYWTAVEKPEIDYTVSVQLIDAQWNKAGQNDSWPMDGNAPTSSWEKGTTLVETRDIPISPECHPGVYDLRLTLYHSDTTGELKHLPVTWLPGQMPVTSLTLTRIRVQ